MTTSGSPRQDAHFWVGGRGRARPSHLGLLELQNSESQSCSCDLYVSPCWFLLKCILPSLTETEHHSKFKYEV